MERQSKSLSPEEYQVLRQYYVVLARKIIPDIPENCPDGECLDQLHKHIKRMIRFLLPLGSPRKGQAGIKHACLFYIAFGDASSSAHKKVRESYTKWLAMMAQLVRDKGFTQLNLDYYNHISDELEQLKRIQTGKEE